MNRSGKECTQLNVLESYLKALGLLDSRNTFPNSGFSIAAVRGLEYVDIWKSHIQNQWYDYRLDDNSLLYFYRNGSEVNYSYLGCPYDCLSYSEYKAKAELDEFNDDDVEELYEDYLGTTELKHNPNYFRYDYEENSYRPGEHPVAHMHCGLMESVRIGFSKQLDLMSFMAFILRQIYNDKWDIILNNKNDYHELYVHKSNLEDIDSKFYQQLDKNQDFYLF